MRFFVHMFDIIFSVFPYRFSLWFSVFAAAHFILQTFVLTIFFFVFCYAYNFLPTSHQMLNFNITLIKRMKTKKFNEENVESAVCCVRYCFSSCSPCCNCIKTQHLLTTKTYQFTIATCLKMPTMNCNMGAIGMSFQTI